MHDTATLNIVPAHDPRHFRDALSQFATGVAVITTQAEDGRREGLTVNSFSALSLDPSLILWSLRCEAPSLESFVESGRFAVNVLQREQQWISQHFARPAVDKFAGVGWHQGLGGCPLLENSLAQFECAIERTIEAGDHVLFIGLVERFQISEGTPLIFSQGKYCLPVTEEVLCTVAAAGEN